VSAGINITILIQRAARYSDEAYAGPCGQSKKKSCEAREFDGASAECEKKQSDNIFTQAVGLRTGYVAVTCGRQSRIDVQLSTVIGHS